MSINPMIPVLRTTSSNVRAGSTGSNSPRSELRAPVGMRDRRVQWSTRGAFVIPRITYRRDQATLVNAIQQVLDHRFVLREVNIDMHDPRRPVQRRGHTARARPTGHANDAAVVGRVDKRRVRSL